MLRDRVMSAVALSYLSNFRLLVIRHDLLSVKKNFCMTLQNIIIHVSTVPTELPYIIFTKVRSIEATHKLTKTLLVLYYHSRPRYFTKFDVRTDYSRVKNWLVNGVN
jgi:hypothetical protein